MGEITDDDVGEGAYFPTFTFQTQSSTQDEIFEILANGRPASRVTNLSGSGAAGRSDLSICSRSASVL